MFEMSNFKQSLVAAVAALVLTATTVVGAAGPAETGPVVTAAATQTGDTLRG
jgi:outer membrane biogenesis lipoprotein LolB